ncbi:MAG: ComEA family DNA-binding protein [Chitinophagaceae bacterium]|jgi:competence protein ComEA
MWQDHLRSWCTLHRRERLGIALLSLLVVLTWLIPAVFSKPQPVEELYSITAVQIDSAIRVLQSRSGSSAEQRSPVFFTNTNKGRPEQVIILDINQADSLQWEKLPGIGEKLSSRIVRFRERLGGFITVDQLREVYGIRDSLLVALRSRLTVKKDFVPKQIAINSADYTTLRKHPYVSHEFAKALLAYRKAHSRFVSLSQLNELIAVDSSMRIRLMPYVLID